MMNRLTFALFFLLTNILGSSQAEMLDKQFDKKVFDHASVSLSILDADTNEKVYGYNDDLALIPASTLKVITTFSALELLGQDFFYKTKVFLQGEKLSDGSFYGNVTIVGAGDPTLGSPFFKEAKSLEQIQNQIYKALKEKGINCIEGDIEFDNSLFDDSPVHPTWQWNDLSNYYAAGAYPFNVHENLFYIHFNRSPNEFTPSPISHIEPNSPLLNVQSNVKTGKFKSGDNAYVYSHPSSFDLTVEGTIPPGKGHFKIKAALPKPYLFFKEYLIQYLKKNGIHVNGQSENNVKGHELLTTLISPPLSDIVFQINLVSNNLYCEAITKTLGTNNGIVVGNRSKGITRILNYLKNNDLNSDIITYKDGSGLSNRNRITTSLQTQFLKLIYNRKGLKFIQDHLPLAGPHGDIKYMFENLDNKKFKVYLKSGSMEQVLGYSGIVVIEEKTYAFSFLCNSHLKGNRKTRKAFESLMNSFIVNYLSF